MKNGNSPEGRRLKQARMEIIAPLYKKGWNIRRITDEVRTRLNITCSTRTIWNDINTLLDEWRQTRIQDVDQRLQLELERIDDCVAELWEQWEKSKEDYVQTHDKKVGVPVKKDGNEGQNAENGETTIATVKREHTDSSVIGLGNPAYIAEIRQQLAERRKLLGLYASTKTEVTGKDGTALIPPSTMTTEDIEAEIARIRASRNDK